MASGLLVFYRWPHGTPLHSAPACVRQVFAGTAVKLSKEYEILCVRIGKQQQVPAGVRMAADDVRLATGSTAFMLMHMIFEDVASVDLMDRSFGGRCLLCRYDNSGDAPDKSGLDHARSAVAWFPGVPDPVELAKATGQAATLTTLIDSGLAFAPALLKSMLACAEALTPELRREKKTRTNHNKAVEELQRAVHTVAGNVVVCPLARVHEPTRLIQEFLAASAAVPAHVAPFDDVISRTSNIMRMQLLRPGLGDPQQPTGNALRLVLHQWENSAVDTLGNGRACWPRAGRLRVSADPKKRKAAGTKIIFNQDGTDRPETVSKDETGKSSGMWVASYNEVDRWLGLSAKPMNAETLAHLGRVVFVSGVGPRCKTATVAPRIQTLPRIVGTPFALSVADRPLPEDDAWHLVITVLLEDLHRFFYTHEAYRAIIQSVTPMLTLGALSLGSASLLHQNQSNTCGVLRSYLGLAPQRNTVQHVHSIHDVLGPPGSAARAELMAQVEVRMGKHFSAAQRSFFTEWEMPTAVLDCVPGAGKTTLLAGVAVAVALRPNARVKIIVTEPNKVMAATVLDVYRALLGDRLVARVGLNAASGYDHLEEFLEATVNLATECDAEILAALDLCIALLSDALCSSFSPEDRCNVERGATVLRLYCELLARRHAYLTTHFYALQSQARETAIKDCLVFVLTSSLLQKMGAGCVANALSEHYNDGSTRWWYQCDEYHQEPYIRLGASLAGTDAAILVGDPAQAEHSEGRSGNIGGAVAVGGDAARQAHSFDLQPATGWLRDNDVVQKFKASGTRRLGPTMVKVIHAVLPGHFPELVSEKDPSNDTLFLPVLFENLTGWVHRENHGCSPGPDDSDNDDSEKPEADREPLFFSHACAVVALELVCVRQRTSPVTPADGVIIIAFLNSVLDSFQLYLARCMPDVCAAIHTCAGLPAPASSDVYDLQTCCLDNLIKLSSVKTAGGVDKRAAVLLGGHRRLGDPSWAGDCLKKSQIGVGFTRASGRFYAFLEDQRASVLTACGGQVGREGAALGLSSVDTTRRDIDPRAKQKLEKRVNQARAQLPWVRACCEAESSWATSLQVPALWRCILDSSAKYPAPIWQSPVLWDALAADGADHVVRCFRAPGHAAAQRVLDAAWGGFATMEWVRGASDPKSLKGGPKANSVKEVLGGSGDILSAAMQGDINLSRNPAPPQFREDVTKIYRLPKDAEDSDSEPEGAPSAGWLRRLWRAARIDCMTIHVRGGSDVLVMVPVATVILTPNGTVDGLPWNTGDHAVFNPCWLLREMFADFEERVRGHSDDTFRTQAVFHKMDVVEFTDGCSTSIRSAGSDRPAFIMERATASDNDEPQWSEIIHVYPAMGLPHQHRGQQALLARCYTPLAAQAFAAVAQQWLQVEMYTSQVVRAFSKRTLPEEQESLFNEFLIGLDSHLLKPRLRAPGGRPLSDFHVAEACVGRAGAGHAWVS